MTPQKLEFLIKYADEIDLFLADAANFRKELRSKCKQLVEIIGKNSLDVEQSYYADDKYLDYTVVYTLSRKGSKKMIVELIGGASGWSILFMLPDGRPNTRLLGSILERARVPYLNDDETGQKFSYKHRDLSYKTPLSEIAAVVQPLLAKLCASMK